MDDDGYITMKVVVGESIGRKLAAIQAFLPPELYGGTDMIATQKRLREENGSLSEDEAFVTAIIAVVENNADMRSALLEGVYNSLHDLPLHDLLEAAGRLPGLTEDDEPGNKPAVGFGPTGAVRAPKKISSNSNTRKIDAIRAFLPEEFDAVFSVMWTYQALPEKERVTYAIDQVLGKTQGIEDQLSKAVVERLSALLPEELLETAGYLPGTVKVAEKGIKLPFGFAGTGDEIPLPAGKHRRSIPVGFQLSPSVAEPQSSYVARHAKSDPGTDKTPGVR